MRAGNVIFVILVIVLLFVGLLALLSMSGAAGPVPPAIVRALATLAVTPPPGLPPATMPAPPPIQPKPGSEPGRPGTVLDQPPGSLPAMATKPRPAEITFQGCPPEGDGGDPALNRLKNRVDEGVYVPVTFDAVAGLRWPKGIERRDRDRWSAADAATVARSEGIPVAVEGYLAGARQSEPESCNCHGADPQFLDWHVWLTATAGQDRSRSIVVETTPRVRSGHPGWTLPALSEIARRGQKVRISGWLMLDPEHPEQLNKTRGTLWEIHPIMKIEVDEGGRWVSLDDKAR